MGKNISLFATLLIAFGHGVDGAALYDVYRARSANATADSVPPTAWAALNTTVGGRLRTAQPLAAPCYAQVDGMPNPHVDLGDCARILANRNSGEFLASRFSGFFQNEWADCMTTSESCPLDFNGTQVTSPASGSCLQGSVSRYYINVSSPADIQAGVKFANQYHIPLVIKNTGHDHRGRSAAPGSLALWTHNYQPPITLTRDFTPAGCTKPSGDVVTFGAGEGFEGIYSFADKNNVTVIGGGSFTVGAAGGWITGGGHSALSPTLGLGVDNVQEIRAVLPNGDLITASRCQNQDMFFALRGGGGGTFGVVVDMSMTAHPKLELQYATFAWNNLSPADLYNLLVILTSNANKWADEGFGGYIINSKASMVMSILTPLLSTAAANSSLAPLWGFKTPDTAQIKHYSGFYSVCQAGLCSNLNSSNNIAAVMSSRLIPSSTFEHNHTAVARVLSNMSINATAANDTDGTPFFACLTAPNPKFVTDDGTSAITPAWRKATWHILSTGVFSDTATLPVIKRHFKMVHDRINPLRQLTPGSGAYQNEADAYEPSHERSFWGPNYERLLAIKKRVDPQNIMSCHQGIGWDKNDPRFKCYPRPGVVL